MTNKLKITVLKKFYSKDVFGHDFTFPNGYVVKDCERVQEGQEFFVKDDLSKPEGFCDWAWVDIYRDVAILAMGGTFAGGDLEGTKYSCCSDGIKPVVFFIERIKD